MYRYFLDTSAFTKIYVNEKGTETMLDLTEEADPDSLVILVLTRVELRSALRRRQRSHESIKKGVERAITAVERHFQAGRYTIIPLTDSILDCAVGLIDRYPLRAYDAIQLAGCLSLREEGAGEDSPVFVCADKQMLLAAEQESLVTLNPEE